MVGLYYSASILGGRASQILVQHLPLLLQEVDAAEN